MRRTRPEPRLRAARGVTLIELVVAMVLLGIVVGATIYFLYPVRQAIDLTVRAELTDTADNALQRIGREVRSALPNSVRVDASGQFLEFIPVLTAGRYRAEGYGAGAPVGTPCDGAGFPDSDQLVFDSATDTCFKPIGTVLNSISTADHLVLNNYGAGFTGQNAYATGGILNRRRISAAATAGTNDRIRFTSATAFDHSLHDSAARRFYVVTGNAGTALPEPVTFYCAAGTLMRRSGYAMTAAQPTVAGGPQALLANNVSGCLFTYAPNVAPQIGLLTLRLTLSKPRSDGGAETVSLYHAAHVSNLP